MAEINFLQQEIDAAKIETMQKIGNDCSARIKVPQSPNLRKLPSVLPMCEIDFAFINAMRVKTEKTVVALRLLWLKVISKHSAVLRSNKGMQALNKFISSLKDNSNMKTILDTLEGICCFAVGNGMKKHR